MATQSRATLKNYFNTGDKPTEAQFTDLIDSMALTTEVLEGTLPQTDHYKFVAEIIQPTPTEEVEIIGILNKDNPDENTLAVGIVKDNFQNNEMAILGSYTTGVRVLYDNIQPDGSADKSIHISGIAPHENWTENDYFHLLSYNSNTQEVHTFSPQDLNILLYLVLNMRKTLKHISFSDINNTAATAQIQINLDGYTFSPGTYAEKILLQIEHPLDNLSAITAATITLPGSSNPIDIFPHLGTIKTLIIPIDTAQEISSIPGTATLTITFDGTNPQNFTQGNITIACMVGSIYN